MVFQMWVIRPFGQNFDTNIIYENHPTLFSIELHHGGRFLKFPGIDYVGGNVRFVDLLDIDEFSVHEMDTIMSELGYSAPPVIYYHFRIPQTGFDFGLRALGNDDDVRNLAQYVGDNKVIQVYTEHGSTNLVTYFMSPNASGRVVIREIVDDEVPPPENHENEEEKIDSYMAMILYESPEFQRGRQWKPVMGETSCSSINESQASGILKANESQACQYKARWNGAAKYQVHGPWQDQHVVDINNLCCSCRKWELTGIPCKHAIAALNEMSKSSDFSGNVYQWVHKVYFLDTWKKAYEFKVEPIKGRAMWPRSSCPTKLTPPMHHKQAGRPKKKRKRTEDERSQSQKASEGGGQAEKLTRKHISVTCRKCKNKGHNSRTCKGQGGK